MVALKTELWITRGLSILTLIVIVFFSVVTIARENETMDEEQLNSFAKTDYVDEHDKELSIQIKEGDAELKEDLSELKSDMQRGFEDFKEDQKQLHDVQNSKIDGYQRTVIEMFKLQNPGK